MCGNRKEISWFLPTGHPHAGTPFFLLLRNQPSLCLLLNEKNWATATCSVLFFLFALSYLVFVPLKNIPVAVTCIAVLSCHSSPLQQIFSRFYRFASIFSIYGPRTQRDFRVLLGLRAVERNWPRTCSWRTRTDRFHSFVTIKKGGWVIFCWIGKWKFSQGSSASVGAGGTRAKKKTTVERTNETESCLLLNDERQVELSTFFVPSPSLSWRISLPGSICTWNGRDARTFLNVSTSYLLSDDPHNLISEINFSFSIKDLQFLIVARNEFFYWFFKFSESFTDFIV